LSNVESRHHDLREADFEPIAYDLVHCRAVLMHLAKPEEALARMARAVRPGGWLLIQEGDYGWFGSVDPTYPGASEFDRAIRASLDAVQSRGFVQSYFGRRLPGLVERIGFANFGSEGSVYIGRGGNNPLARFHSLSGRIPEAAERLIQLGVRTREQTDHVLRMYDDPAFEFIGPTLVSAWAQRP
jgi:SAM-dependent methyltransferase